MTQEQKLHELLQESVAIIVKTNPEKSKYTSFGNLTWGHLQMAVNYVEQNQFYKLEMFHVMRIINAATWIQLNTKI
jgi:hypothetical protein